LKYIGPVTINDNMNRMEMLFMCYGAHWSFPYSVPLPPCLWISNTVVCYMLVLLKHYLILH